MCLSIEVKSPVRVGIRFNCPASTLPMRMKRRLHFLSHTRTFRVDFSNSRQQSKLMSPEIVFSAAPIFTTLYTVYTRPYTVCAHAPHKNQFRFRHVTTCSRALSHWLTCSRRVCSRLRALILAIGCPTVATIQYMLPPSPPSEITTAFYIFWVINRTETCLIIIESNALCECVRVSVFVSRACGEHGTTKQTKWNWSASSSLLCLLSAEGR